MGLNKSYLGFENMFQLSKKVEYGLIAMRHMALSSTGHMFTTKEIADAYQLPYELLAKVMQKLAKEEFISSYQGVNGGYVLARHPGEVKVSSIINAIEGQSSVSIIQCEAQSSDQCSILLTCTIKNPLVKLQGNINKMFEDMTILEMV
jgi:Rrf2 family protein